MPDVTSALTAGRVAAESRMRDTCRITRPGTGPRVLNPTTRKYEDPTPVTVYEGACRIPFLRGTAARNGGATQAFVTGEYPLDLPVVAGAVDVAGGMTVTYLTAPDNPLLEGMVFGVVEPLLLSQGTKLRFKMKTTVAV